MLTNKKMIIICILQYLCILTYHLIYSFLYGTIDQTIKCAVWSICILIIQFCMCSIFRDQISLIVNFTMISVLVTVTYVGYILESLAFAVAIYFASCLIVSLFLNKIYTLTWCIESIIFLIIYTIIFPNIILKMVPSMFLFYGYIFVYILGCANAYLLVVLAQRSYAVLKNETIKAQLEGATKNIFWGNISNEIKTPMNVINGMSQLLKTESLNERAREYTDQIENASNILLNIVNDTVILSQIEAGTQEVSTTEYDIYNVLHNAIMTASKNIVLPGVSLVYCINPSVPSTLLGDEHILKDILVKLINTSIIFTSSGEIRIDIEVNDKIKTKKEYIPLNIKIKDSGNGFTSEEISSLFMGFDDSNASRTTEQESVGLSLKLCKSMVELLGGDITVESELGKGTCFTISLIQQFGNENKINNKLDTDENSIGESFESISANVLVVDDTPTNLKLIAGMIKLHGISPDTAESGIECLTKMSSKKYDLVFLDIMMTDLDGEETLKQIKAKSEEISNYKDVPIIALTTKTIQRDRERFISEGFDEFLSKPVDDKELVSLLKKFLKHKY